MWIPLDIRKDPLDGDRSFARPLPTHNTKKCFVWDSNPRSSVWGTSLRPQGYCGLLNWIETAEFESQGCSQIFSDKTAKQSNIIYMWSQEDIFVIYILFNHKQSRATGKSQEMSISIVGLQAGIWTSEIPNAKQELRSLDFKVQYDRIRKWVMVAQSGSLKLFLSSIRWIFPFICPPWNLSLRLIP
jgi:hypothetical protein